MAESAFTIQVDTKARKWDEALRQRLIAFSRLYKWSYGQISRDMQRYHGKRKDKDGRPGNVGIGEGSLYRYANLKWAGSPEDLNRLENKVRLWLDHREAQDRVDDIDEGVSAAKLIMNGLEEAAQARKFVAIIGPSGMGKTLVAKHFANTKTRGGVVMIESYDGMRPPAFLRAICRGIGEVDSGTVDDLITRAAERLETQPLVLAIDEANFLTITSINHLIRIWNSAKNGIVLLGTEELERIITSPRLQRVRSRLKVMIHLGELSDAEIRARLEEVFDADEVNTRVVEVARIGSFGSFRDLDTIIEAAIEAREQNPSKSLEAVFERVASRKTDRRKRKK